MAEATSPTKESKAKPENYLFVVSLDFGTTYSGYAFSSRSDFENNPLSIHTIQESRAGGSPLISLKTSTSILIKKDGSFVAFGYEAEDKFYSEMENNQRKEVMLFRRFKMKLYNKMVKLNKFLQFLYACNKLCTDERFQDEISILKSNLFYKK